MKEIKLEIKDTYENVVAYINKNIDVTEPTKFIFTKIVKTNAKMRKCPKYNNVYEFEEEGIIKLNDNNHKRNLYYKVCVNGGTQYVDFERMGID